MAAVVGLSDQLHKRPGALSGGQRQRVALARAILRKPGSLPFRRAAVEPRCRVPHRDARRDRALPPPARASMVYVTHDQTEAMTMGDRIAVLLRLPRACREPDAVRHAGRRVSSPGQSFCRAIHRHAAHEFRDASGRGWRHQFRQPAPRPVRCRGPIDLSRRWATAGASAAVPGKVRKRTFGNCRARRKSRPRDHSDAGNGPRFTGLRQTRSGAAPSFGQSVRVALNMAQLHLFDPTTEARID